MDIDTDGSKRQRTSFTIAFAALGTLAVLVAIFLFAGAVGNTSTAQAEFKQFDPNKSWTAGMPAKIIRVIDGDTIVLDFKANAQNATVRLIGIDTPEVRSQFTNEECYGPQASRYLKALAAEEVDVYVFADQQFTDVYGRLLLYVFRASDGKFLNLKMIQEGYAKTLFIKPNLLYQTEFKAAERKAKSMGLGLWEACRDFM